MRVRNQKVGRARLGAGIGMVLVVAVATAAPGIAEAQGPSAPSSEPLVLAADRIRFWDDARGRWLVLDGHAAVLQGAEGLRAGRAAVRVVAEAGRPGLSRVVVFAEGHVRATEPDAPERAWSRASWVVAGPIQARPYEAGAMAAGRGDPAADPLLRRAFPELAPRAAAAPPAPAADRPRPRPEPVAAADPGEGVSVALGAPIAEPPAEAPRVDPALRRAQFEDVFDGMPGAGFGQGPVLEDEESDFPNPEDLPEDLDTAPPAERPPRPPAAPDVVISGPPAEAGAAPVLPNTQRVWWVNRRDASPSSLVVKQEPDGTTVFIYLGGVVVVADAPKQGTIDITADRAVIWMRPKPDGSPNSSTKNAEGKNVQDERDPLEVYLEGNVVFRQDARKVAGDGDQKIYFADTIYYNFPNDRMIADNAEANIFAAGLLAPLKTKAPRVEQYRPVETGPNGLPRLGPARIYATQSTSSASRFPNPGYRFNSSSIDLFQVPDLGNEYPTTRTPEKVLGYFEASTPQKQVWRIDARQNVFYMGPVPVFYWPHILADSDDLDPPLRNIQFRANQIFGPQVLSNWNVFKILGARKPAAIDYWNLDVDYLRYRGPALGTELGWQGRDFFGDLMNPYRRKSARRNVDQPYVGYFDAYGIHDAAEFDILGTGPAIVTDRPVKNKFDRMHVPIFSPWRGKLLMRHMQSLLPPDAEDDDDFRLQAELGLISDRHFLEEYFKMQFDSGMDYENLAYLIRQRENRAFTTLVEFYTQSWQSESFWLPKLDYYRLGDSLLGNRLTYFQHSGVDFAHTQVAPEINNTLMFRFIPYDPVNNLRYNFNALRAYTSHEVDYPIKLGFLRVVPYVQGQLVGWSDQINNQAAVGRAWGAGGVRANFMVWRTFPGIRSDLFNLNGLAHKINFAADYRYAKTNYGNILNLGIQDDLDDNTYEIVRRYFAMVFYTSGTLPPQYNPLLLTMRRTMSPITGTTDVQGNMDTLQLDLRQRLQTKRGPIGRQRVTDWMLLDLHSTYFPQASRDNFGVPFGQNMYNWQWFIGDRTSILSYGWFEFFNIKGQENFTNPPVMQRSNFSVINNGISISRPPRGNVYFGYSIIDTGPIKTSALNIAYSYWMSPKWYSTFGTSYDFGNKVWLNAWAAFTRIGADYLTSIGLTVDPQRRNYTFGVTFSPRISPSARLGTVGGRFDQRYAPTQ